MAEGWMGWQRGRTIMADLQDTNAATEEIYGPLLIVYCPVTEEMISQSSGRTAASARERSFSCPSALFINQMFWVEATPRSAPRKQQAGHKHDKDGGETSARGRVKLSGRIRGMVRCAGSLHARPSANVTRWRKLVWYSCNMQELLWGSHHGQ